MTASDHVETVNLWLLLTLLPPLPPHSRGDLLSLQVPFITETTHDSCAPCASSHQGKMRAARAAVSTAARAAACGGLRRLITQRQRVRCLSSAPQHAAAADEPRPPSPAVEADADSSRGSPSLPPSGGVVLRFSDPLRPRALTSTTARLWELRREAAESSAASPSSSAAAPTVRTISNESSIFPRHPRFETMDRQLSSALQALSSRAASRPYLLPSDSALSILLPLASSSSVYEQYVRFDGGVRFGKILEDLDAFAANVSHMHLLLGSGKGDYLPPGQVMLVTASVDSIVLQRRFTMDSDVVMRGRCNWVGNSSLEVNIAIYALEPSHQHSAAPSPPQQQQPAPAAVAAGTDPLHWEKTRAQRQSELAVQAEAGSAEPDLSDYEEEKILDAVFLMVARNAATNKAATVCPLSLQHMTEAERAQFQQGERNKERRRQDMKTSLVNAPPTHDEVQLLHQMLMPSPAADAQQSLALAGAVIRPKTVGMRETEQRSSDMTQPQERNTNGKIFGGSLMRRAYELARTTAYIFAGPGSRPYLVASDTITFLRPVEIGSVITFTAFITYSPGHPVPLFQCKVDTRIRDLVTGASFVSNTFQFSFQCDHVPLRRVQPGLYSEAMEWLEGRRLLLRMQQRRDSGQHQHQQHQHNDINELGTQVHN